MRYKKIDVYLSNGALNQMCVLATVKGDCSPYQKIACFECYLKIIPTLIKQTF